MIGTKIAHPNYDGAEVVRVYETCGVQCLEVAWRGQTRRITADSCKPKAPEPVGFAPSGRPTAVLRTPMRPATKKPNGKPGAHTPYPVSLYEIAKAVGKSREAIAQYVARHGYEAALKFYGYPPAPKQEAAA